MPTLTNRWAVLALLFLVRLIFPIQYQQVAPLVPFMVSDMGINYAQVGMLIGAFMLPGAFLALPSGLLGVRFGDKAVVLLGLGLMASGTELLAFSNGFTPAFIGRLLSGAGAVMLNVQIAKLITDWFAGRELSTAYGIHLGSFPLGVSLSLSTLGLVAEASSWRMAVHLTGLCTISSLVLMGLLYRDPGGRSASQAAPGLSGFSISRRELVLILTLSSLWVLFNTGYMVFMSFAPTLLVDRGHTVVQAGFLVGIASWVSIISTPLGGILVDWSGRINSFIWVGTIISTAGIVLLVWGGPIVVWMVLLGIAFGLVPGAVMALPQQVLLPTSRSMGFGIFYTFVFLGFGALPAVAGWLHDVTGSADMSMYFSGAVTLFTIPALLLFRALQRRLGSPGLEHAQGATAGA